MRASLVVAILVASVGLGGCAGVNKLINGDPKPVDPSQELTFQPLSIPPDYAVVPQTSAAAAPSDQSAGGQADTSQSSTAGGSDLSASPSPDVSAGEQALLDAANADKANPDIRALIASDFDRQRRAHQEPDRRADPRHPRGPGGRRYPKERRRRRLDAHDHPRAALRLVGNIQLAAIRAPGGGYARWRSSALSPSSARRRSQSASSGSVRRRQSGGTSAMSDAVV